MLFMYDQARDAFAALEITSGNLRILGPTTDIPGLAHGVFYYYFLAPLYFFGRGNPHFALTGLILVNLISLIPLGILIQKLFNNKIITLTALLLYAVSLEAVSYARWISNPSLAIPALATFYLGCWQIINKEKIGWIFVALGMGLAIQAQFFLMYIIPLFLIILFVFKVELKEIKYLIASIALLTTFLLSFLFAEIKFRFQGILGLKDYFLQGGDYLADLPGYLNNYYVRSKEVITNNLVPQSEHFSVIIFLIALFIFVYFIKKERGGTTKLKFLLILLFSNILVQITSELHSAFISLGIAFPILIIVSYAICKLAKVIKIAAVFMLLLIVIFNIMAVDKDNQRGNPIFALQEGVRLKDQFALIEKTYEIAGNKQFSISAATNPLFTPTTFAYLYDYYTKKNNKQLPHYHGNTASVFPGDHVFPRSGEITETEFTLIESDLPEFWVKKAIEDDDLRKPVVDFYTFSNLKLLVRN